jgi:DNA-binding NtrC family response regulator
VIEVPSEAKAGTMISNAKIFVVDDERQIADVVSLVLRKAQYDVETFYDAHSAMLRASDHPPDILITDVAMPEIDGITLAYSVRGLNPNCKIILISGNPHWKTDGKLQVAIRDGFTVLQKPFSPRRILRLIQSEQE